LGINKHLEWNIFVEQIRPKLNNACYDMRTADMCKTIHYACFYFIMNYEIVFWGNSMNSKRVSQLQKRTVRIMTQARFKVNVNLFSNH